MNYLSVCSGIEAASVAWHPLGWNPVAFSEIEAFPSAVLAHHYPNVPNLGDMTKFKEWGIEPGTIDVLVGGTPCQSFSVAGLRKGLADPRGNLMLTYGALADYLRPSWIVWENVPGVLSSNGGRDFGTFLGMLGELGYGFAYRVLDAQFFGVPQRRRRVFVVGYLGDWRPAAAVLFESESLRGDTPPSREARKDVTELAGTLAANGGGTTRPAGNCNELDFCVTVGPTLSARTKAGGGLGTDFDLDGGLIAHTLRGSGFDASEDGTGRGTPIVPVAIQDIRGMDKKQNGKGWNDDGTAYTVDAMATQGVMAPIAFPANLSGTQYASTEDLSPSMGAKNPTAVAFESRFARNGRGAPSEIVPPLKAQSGQTGKGDAAPLTMTGTAVRRLTPRECERLQGFPDDWTLIPWRGKPAPDGPRYKACGNSMAVPVMRWIGERINKYAKGLVR